MGEIKFYEFYEDCQTILYRLDVKGNMVRNYRLFYLINDFYSISLSNGLSKNELKLMMKYGELYLEFFQIVKDSIDRIDPFGIASISPIEYRLECRKITSQLIGKNLNKNKIFKKVKNIFDECFNIYDDNVVKYKNITKELFIFYMKKKKNGEWKDNI